MRRLPLCALALIAILSLCACQPDDLPYFPVGDDTLWIYDVQVRNWRDVNVQRSREAVRGMPAVRDKGHWLFRRWRHDDSIAFYRPGPDGLVHVGTAPAGSSRTPDAAIPRQQLLLPNPPSVGATWQRDGMTFLIPVFACGYCTTTAPISTVIPIRYRIESNSAAVTVPAGRFERCLHVTGSGKAHVDSGSGTGWIDLTVETEEWYAPGIGLVKSRWREIPHSRMLSDGEFGMALSTVLHGRQ